MTCFLIDICWTFLLPSICLFSILSNCINSSVFYRLKSKYVIYKYMFFNSIGAIGYLFTVAFVFLIRCGQFCEIKDSLVVKVYHLYAFKYMAASFGLFCILVEIIISLQRICLILNKKLPEKINSIFLLFLLAFCFIFYIKILYMFEIRPLADGKNTTINIIKSIAKYEMVNVFYDKSFLIRIFMALQAGVRLLLIMCLVFTLNVLTYLYFKKHTQKKNQLKDALSPYKSKIY